MKHPVLMIIVSIVVIFILTGALAFGYEWYADKSDKTDDDWNTDMKMEGIRLTLADLAEASVQAEKDFIQQIRDNLDLLTLPLRSIVQREEDDAIRYYEYGCVLRSDGENLILPEVDSADYDLRTLEYTGDYPLTDAAPNPFKDREGAFWGKMTMKDQENTEDGKSACARPHW